MNDITRTMKNEKWNRSDLRADILGLLALPPSHCLWITPREAQRPAPGAHRTQFLRPLQTPHRPRDPEEAHLTTNTTRNKPQGTLVRAPQCHERSGNLNQAHQRRETPCKSRYKGSRHDQASWCNLVRNKHNPPPSHLNRNPPLFTPHQLILLMNHIRKQKIQKRTEKETTRRKRTCPVSPPLKTPTNRERKRKKKTS